MALQAEAEYSALGGENSCSLSAALRAPEGSFGAETAMVSGQTAVIGGQSPDRSVECRITAADALGRRATALRLLPQRRWAMKFRPDGRGVAFGKAPERAEALELPAGWQIRVGAESLWSLLHPVGTLLLADAAPAEGSWTEVETLGSTRLWRRTA